MSVYFSQIISIIHKVQKKLITNVQSFVQAINFAHFDFSFSNLLNYLLCSSLSICLLKTKLQLLIFANKNSKLLFVRLDLV